jgi:hypothetical protein
MLLFYIVSGLVILVYCFGVGFWINWDVVKASRPVRPRDVRRRVQDADRQVQLAHHEARRQMNEAAGQRWLNMAG